MRVLPATISLLMVVSSCRSAGREPPTGAATHPAPVDGTQSASAGSDSGVAPAASASAAPVAAPQTMPSLASVQTLHIKSRQGGAFHPKCGGVISELTIDFTKDQWTRGLCSDESRGASSNPNRPLDTRSGKLTPQHRAMLDAEYAKLVPRSGPSCGTDVGRIELTLRRADGSTQTFVNTGTSCGDAPPEVAHDLGEFLGRVFTISSKP